MTAPTRRLAAKTVWLAAVCLVLCAELVVVQQGTVGSKAKISSTSGSGGFQDRLYNFGTGITPIGAPPPPRHPRPPLRFPAGVHDRGATGDLDGDGVVDIAVSAIGNSFSAPFIHTIFLTTAGKVKARTRISNGIGGLAAGTAGLGKDFGRRMSGLGDLDGDGNCELAVGE